MYLRTNRTHKRIFITVLLTRHHAGTIQAHDCAKGILGLEIKVYDAIATKMETLRKDSETTLSRMEAGP